MFQTFFELGLKHITDFQGYDHILFISTVCALYTVKDFKKIGFLVTAFTLGHSLTLALVSLGFIPRNIYWIELLIPVTILITSILNISAKFPFYVHFVLVLLFGLIHGMGFSNYFEMLLSDDTPLLAPLFVFNLGIECGQLVIVAIALLFNFLYLKYISNKHIYWQYGISFVAILLSIKMIWERF
jgi:hypothetical protein